MDGVVMALWGGAVAMLVGGTFVLTLLGAR